MAWYVSTKASKVYACETCTDTDKEQRNCEGNFYNAQGKHRFSFQVGDPQLGSAETHDEKFINECPTLYIQDFTRLLWGKYQDIKLKNEMGLPIGDIPNWHFKSFKVLALSLQEYDDWKSKKDKKKNKRSNAGLQGIRGGKKTLGKVLTGPPGKALTGER